MEQMQNFNGSLNFLCIKMPQGLLDCILEIGIHFVLLILANPGH